MITKCQSFNRGAHLYNLPTSTTIAKATTRIQLTSSFEHYKKIKVKKCPSFLNKNELALSCITLGCSCMSWWKMTTLALKKKKKIIGEGTKNHWIGQLIEFSALPNHEAKLKWSPNHYKAKWKHTMVNCSQALLIQDNIRLRGKI